MLRSLLRRLLVIPWALLLVNFLGFAYAHLAYRFHLAQNPYGTSTHAPIPISDLYLKYLQGVAHLDFGRMPDWNEPVSSEILKAGAASLGLLSIAFLISTLLGLLVGLRAVRSSPPEVAPWLVSLSSVGLAAPSFYIGSLFIVAGVYYLILAGPEAKLPIPMQGFGWDIHLLLPVLALTAGPTFQIARVSSGLLSQELHKQYIVAARSRGNSWRQVRWKHALRNVLAPVILTIAGSFRLLVVELVLVEWLFDWPGLGRLLALTLVPPQVASLGGMMDLTVIFLNPELVAALLTVFTLLFLIADTLASVAIRLVDPRLTAGEVEEAGSYG